MNSRTPDASSTMIRMFALWNPWKRSPMLVEKPYAKRLLDSSSRVWVILPPDGRERCGVCLAGTVAGSDCDEFVVAECFEDVSLFLPGFGF